MSIKSETTITKTIQGYYSLSYLSDKTGQLISHLYIDYTKKEALEAFAEFVKEQEGKFI